MSKKPKQPGKKTLRIIPILIVVAVLGIFGVAGAFAFGASQESHDSFCASCHTQPESTFYQRTQGSSHADLASYHTTQTTNCIDCHSGAGITGRIQAELMGASNAARWFTGTAVQPGVLGGPYPDENCLKCHQDVTQQGFVAKEKITIQGASLEGRRSNHYHQFLSRWQAADPIAGNCNSCHSGHLTDPTATVQTGFMNSQDVQSTCNACHKVLRKDDGG